MSPFHTVVVATDFSETAEEALSVALELVEGTDREIAVVHVVLDPLHQPWMVDAAGVDFPELQRSWVEGAEHEFQALLKRRRLNASALSTHIVIGRPDFEIVRFAEEHGADLLVMGTHGYSGVKRFFLGSVADRVVREARCPVLVVPAKTVPAHEVTAKGSDRREATAHREATV
jgi:nucleotide-binding universal stress UspA family protein